MGETCITGYHGTTQSYAGKILKEQKFLPSSSKKEWLGKGVYFFDDRNHAIGWAHIRARKNKESVAVVLAADVCVKSSEFFDLDIPENVLRLEDYFEASIDDGEFVGGAPRFQSDDELRCFTANYYKRTHPEIKVLAYTFDSTQKTRMGFAIKQRQLCVSSHDVISNIRTSYTATTGKGGYYRG